MSTTIIFSGIESSKKESTVKIASPLLNPSLPNLFVSDDDFSSLELLEYLKPANIGDTGIKDDSNENSKSSGRVSHERFMEEIVDKIESLPMDKTVKSDAIGTMLYLMRDIGSKQFYSLEFFIHSVHSTYICIKWRKGTKGLSLNIDDEEQWWSMNWEEGNKTKTDFANVDDNNLSTHWKWLIND